MKYVDLNRSSLLHQLRAAVAKYGKMLVFTFDDVTSDLQGVSQPGIVQTVRLCIGNT